MYENYAEIITLLLEKIDIIMVKQYTHCLIIII